MKMPSPRKRNAARSQTHEQHRTHGTHAKCRKERTLGSFPANRLRARATCWSGAACSFGTAVIKRANRRDSVAARFDVQGITTCHPNATGTKALPGLVPDK